MKNRKLRIVTWNCNGRLRDKWTAIAALEADIFIVQECEDPASHPESAYMSWANSTGNYLWTGPTTSKGIGVFNRSQYPMKKLQLNDGSTGVFLPIEIDQIPIVAVWTRNAQSGRDKYIRQAVQYFRNHSELLGNPSLFIAGDFNSNAIWNRLHPGKSHSDLVKDLSKHGVRSLYHAHSNEEPGQETTPTFFQYRNLLKPYHIDYGFAGRAWICHDVQIEPTSTWLAHSDHLPLTFSLEQTIQDFPSANLT